MTCSNWQFQIGGSIVWLFQMGSHYRHVSPNQWSDVHDSFKWGGHQPKKVRLPNLNSFQVWLLLHRGLFYERPINASFHIQFTTEYWKWVHNNCYLNSIVSSMRIHVLHYIFLVKIKMLFNSGSLKPLLSPSTMMKITPKVDFFRWYVICLDWISMGYDNK